MELIRVCVSGRLEVYRVENVDAIIHVTIIGLLCTPMRCFVLVPVC